MFTNIKFCNMYGIDTCIKLDFLSKSRNKEENNTIFTTKDNKHINKITGIIGGNSSGKSSIVDSIGFIGDLLSFPIAKDQIYKDIEKLQDDAGEKDERYDSKMLMEILRNIKRGINFKIQNVKHIYDNSLAEIEMYIEDEDEYTGYYSYYIEFNNENIISEKLNYRKEYNSRNITDIINVTNIKESQVGYSIVYSNNIKNLEDIDEKKYNLCKVFYEHYMDKSRLFNGLHGNRDKLELLDWLNTNKEELLEIIRIADPKIKDIKIEDIENIIIYFVLNDNTRILYRDLSTGTKRFIMMMKEIEKVIKSNGVFVIDEIEQNLHTELVELIIKLFSANKETGGQIIFTSHTPEIFDMTYDNKKIFRNDQIIILSREKDYLKAEKLIDIKFDNKKIRVDASVTNLYRNKLISFQPDENNIKKFLDKFNKIVL